MLKLNFGAPCRNRTCNYSLGGNCYIHLTKGTSFTNDFIKKYENLYGIF